MAAVLPDPPHVRRLPVVFVQRTNARLAELAQDMQRRGDGGVAFTNEGKVRKSAADFRNGGFFGKDGGSHGQPPASTPDALSSAGHTYVGFGNLNLSETEAVNAARFVAITGSC